MISRSLCIRWCILVAPLALSLQLLSAAGPPPEVGMPLVHNYYSRDYKGGGQDWTIFQDRRGVMLLG